MFTNAELDFIKNEMDQSLRSSFRGHDPVDPLEDLEYSWFEDDPQTVMRIQKIIKKIKLVRGDHDSLDGKRY